MHEEELKRADPNQLVNTVAEGMHVHINNIKVSPEERMRNIVEESILSDALHDSPRDLPSVTHRFTFLPEPIKKRTRVPKSSPSLEHEFQEIMKAKKKSVEMRILYYQHHGHGKVNEKMLSQLKREYWAMIGELDKNIDPAALNKVNERFAHLNLVPSHYNYPELFCFDGQNYAWSFH